MPPYILKSIRKEEFCQLQTLLILDVVDVYRSNLIESTFNKFLSSKDDIKFTLRYKNVTFLSVNCAS